MNPIVIIPARLAATRLPGKPLAEIGGVAMIVRVLRRAEAAKVGPVVVAAGDEAIVRAIRDAGGRVVATDPNLPSGSDRIRAALSEIDPAGRHDAVVNLQGDMPFIDPAALTACLGLLAREPGCDIATCVAAESALSDRVNPDVVKAILALPAGARHGRALYFTRSTLWGERPIWRHIGIYAYRREALARYTAVPPSPLERREKLEQLRALELGQSIWAAVIDDAPLSVDTPADLAVARRYAVDNEGKTT